MIKVLVVEDDRAINGLVCKYLEDSGYGAVSAYDGKEGLAAFESQQFDLIISDIMMPEMDGFAFVKRVRETNKKIPVLFMTALDDKPSKQYGYTLGVDANILMLRVGALIRRANIETARELVAGNLRMNADEHTAYLNGEELPLTVREFDLLYKFLSYPKRTFTRSQLMDEFWDFDSSATSRTVDVYMAKLREKTADCDGFEILTVHGLGYKAVLK